MLPERLEQGGLHQGLRPDESRIIQQDLPRNRRKGISNPDNRKHEEDRHGRVHSFSIEQFSHRDGSVAQIVGRARCCCQGDEHMLLDTPRPRVETECPFRQRDADRPGREPPRQKVADIVTGNLHEEDGIRRLRCTVMAHLRQESPRDNKEEGEQEIATGDGGQSGIVCEADQLADLKGKCCNFGILFRFLLDGRCFADRFDFLCIIQRRCRCRG